MTTRVIGPEPFRGWRRTWRLANDVVECRVVADVGPRVVELRRVGGESVLHLRASEVGGRGERRWRFRGGWRLWIAPEERATTYARDNDACEVEMVDRRTLRVTGPPQRSAGIRKVVTLAIDPRRPRIAVESRIVNVGRKPVTYAPWTLAVLRPGGRAFVPLGRGAPAALASVHRLLLWSYARLDDPRHRVGGGLVEIDHRVVARLPWRRRIASQRWSDESKLGTDAPDGWAAYLLDSTLFVSRAVVEPGPRTDGGATVEVFSCREFIELEHLGVLRTLASGEGATLREDWWLFDGVTLPASSPSLDAVERALGRYVSRLDGPR